MGATNILKPVSPPTVASWGVEPGDAATAPMQVKRLKMQAMDLNMSMG
jgi:hypothetical protein